MTNNFVENVNKTTASNKRSNHNWTQQQCKSNTDNDDKVVRTRSTTNNNNANK